MMLMLTVALPLVYAQRRAPAKPQVKAPTLTVYGKGYQKGFSSGYAEGKNDYSRSTPPDFRKSDAWNTRESAFDQQYATADDYIEAYELGFRLGYSDGYYGRVYSATVPANGETLYKAEALARARRDRGGDRDSRTPDNQPRDRDRRSDNQPRDRDRPSDDVSRPRSSRPIDIPAEIDLRIRLTSPISTRTNKVGDKFTAEVLTPASYEGATIEGHISSLDRSGKISGRTEMSFTFDTITLVDGRNGPISAHLEKIFESESVKEVDEEGNVRSGSRTKDSQVRGGVGATAGAIIGAIAGGVKGAILGAVIGGGAGVGTVAIEGKKDIILDPGTEMIIRTDRSRAR